MVAQEYGPDPDVDCNQNGAPDECEPDCNNNHVADDCDVANGNSADCNGDGMLDECGCLRASPSATILDAVPADGIADARQPHTPATALARQGIGSREDPIYIQLSPPVGRSDGCFSLCETLEDPHLGPNSIECVTPLGDGRYRLVLDHPITAGGVTTIEYAGDGSLVSYTSHPGDVNADGVTDRRDVSALIDSLGRRSAAEQSLLRLDIDHSGTLTFSDMLRLIDLLNGAHPFEVWNGRSLPVNDACPSRVGACCLPDDRCEYLARGHCNYLEGDWTDEGLCGVDFPCAFHNCSGTTGECCAGNDTPGCDDVSCCMAVCEEDLYCCLVLWDQWCAGIAEDQAACACP